MTKIQSLLCLLTLATLPALTPATAQPTSPTAGWSGKTLAVFGDSITFSPSVVPAIARAAGMTLKFNDSLPGRTTADIFADYSGNQPTGLSSGRVTPAGNTLAQDLAGVDLVLIDLGNNDLSPTGTYGSYTDTPATPTFAGAMRRAIEAISHANPSTRIVWITPFDQIARIQAGLVLAGLAQTARAIALDYGVPVLDMSTASGINRFNAYAPNGTSEGFLNDGLHLSGAGISQRFVPLITRFIETFAPVPLTPATSAWNGKRLAAFGDSVFTSPNLITTVAQDTGMSIAFVDAAGGRQTQNIFEGYSGNPAGGLSTGIFSPAGKTLAQNLVGVDLLLIDLGSNNVADSTFGDYTDPPTAPTLAGYIRKALNGILIASPFTRIIWITPTNLPARTAAGARVNGIPQLIQHICQDYGVPVLDAASLSGINAISAYAPDGTSPGFLIDGIHPSPAGTAQRLVPLITRFIDTYAPTLPPH